jgi:hypothetical protein
MNTETKVEQEVRVKKLQRYIRPKAHFDFTSFRRSHFFRALPEFLGRWTKSAL